MNRELKFKFIYQNEEGKIIFTRSYTLEKLLEINEDDIWYDLSDCNCQPIGETNVVECNCDEEFSSYHLIGRIQFTGCTDKYGKDIHEGDIVKSFNKNFEDEPSINTVEFKNGCWRLVCEGKNDIPLFNYQLSELEIIGNIFETPEILKIND